MGIRFRRNTKAAADTSNPVLAAGEPGFATDTGDLRIGDGTSAWTALPDTHRALTVAAGAPALYPATAAADGATDDTTHIQAVIDACPVGGVVDGHGKTFVVTGLLLKSDMEFRNFNLKTKPGTVDMASPVTIGAYSDTTTRRNITIRNVHVDGQRALQDVIGAAEDGGRHGFRLIGAIENLLMEDCSATLCASDGLAIYSGTGMAAIQTYTTGIKKSLRFVRCSFTWNRRHGVSLDCATDVTFEDCKLNDNGHDVSAGSNDGEYGAVLNGSRYGNGIDMEEYSLLTYIGGVRMVRCEALRNAHPGVLIFEPSANLANDPNWTVRSGFDFIDCHFDLGTGAHVTLYGLDITPVSANKTTGTYFTDINIRDCRVDGLVGLRSVGTARHMGGTASASGSYIGNADQVTDLLVTAVDRGVKRYDAANATIRYAVTEPESIWLGPDRFVAIGGTPTLSVYQFHGVWQMSDAEADRIGTVVSIPWDWERVHIDLYWTHTSNSGNVYWRCDTGAALTAGVAITDPPTGTIVTQATGTAGQTYVTRLGTSRTISPGLVPLELLRSGADAADTLPENAFVIGLKITRAK